MLDITDAEAIYMAGIVDCDGSIHVRSQGGTHYLGLSFTNTHKPTIDWVAYVWEANAIPTKRREGHKQSWVVATSGSRAQTILTRIKPYMRIKEDQADLALSFPVGGYKITPSTVVLALRKYIYQGMRMLNKRGYD